MSDNHTKNNNNNDDGPIDDISNETLDGWIRSDSASKVDLSALGVKLKPDDPLLDSMVRFEK